MLAARTDEFVARLAPPQADLFASRQEWKLVVPVAVADRLRAEVASRLTREAFVANRPVTRVHSIYLDSPDFSLYRQCLAPDRPSLKLRIRAYSCPEGLGGGAERFLECKAGVFEGELKRKRKQRVRLSPDRLEALIDPGSPAIDADKRRWGSVLAFARAHALVPRLTVTYLREAYVDADGQLRITFDEGYRASAIAEGLQSDLLAPARTLPGYTVIEVKFLSEFPAWFAAALVAHDIPAAGQSFSKFKTAVALLFPEHG